MERENLSQSFGGGPTFVKRGFLLVNDRLHQDIFVRQHHSVRSSITPSLNPPAILLCDKTKLMTKTNTCIVQCAIQCTLSLLYETTPSKTIEKSSGPVNLWHFVTPITSSHDNVPKPETLVHRHRVSFIGTKY